MSSSRPTTRRTAIGGALAGITGLVTLTGCDPPGLGPSPKPDWSEPPGPTAPDPDAALVAEVLADLAAVLGVVRAVRRADRASRAVLRPLVLLHEAQVTELGGPVDGPVDRPGSGVGDTPDLRLVVTREQALRDRLVEAALAARGGELARLLAQLSAGLSQHLVVLPTAPTAPSPAG